MVLFVFIYGPHPVVLRGYNPRSGLRGCSWEYLRIHYGIGTQPGLPAFKHVLNPFKTLWLLSMIFKLQNSPPLEKSKEKRYHVGSSLTGSVSCDKYQQPFCSEKCSGLDNKFYGIFDAFIINVHVDIFLLRGGCEFENYHFLYNLSKSCWMHWERSSDPRDTKDVKFSML